MTDNPLQAGPEGDAPNCPWCGCRATRWENDRGDWACGSFKHGREPWQSDSCRMNALEARLECYQDALARGGYDISPCRECERPVVCLPDGLGTVCNECRAKERKPKCEAST